MTSTGVNSAVDGSAAPDRLLPLEGCVNFRDLGGYRTADGRQVQWRRLFRADGLNQLSAADRAFLLDAGLATVIDLRTPFEAETRGRFPVDDVPVRYLALPLLDVPPTALSDLSGWDEASYVTARYLDMLRDGSAVLTEAITALAEADSLPAVVHCSAGKDRTGVLSAVLLAFLGVPDETIAADYALSGPAMDRLLARLKADYPNATDKLDQLAPAILNVPAESMEGFLRGVRDTYGTYADLAVALDVVDAVAELRCRLLEDA